MIKIRRRNEELAISRGSVHGRPDAEAENSLLDLGSLKTLLEGAHTYRQLGCGLAWIFVRLNFFPDHFCTGGFFRNMFLDLKAAETRPSPKGNVLQYSQSEKDLWKILGTFC